MTVTKGSQLVQAENLVRDCNNAISTFRACAMALVINFPELDINKDPYINGINRSIEASLWINQAAREDHSVSEIK